MDTPNLNNANLTKAYLGIYKLYEEDGWETNLEMANLRKANLSGANLDGANLKGADLREANLQDASFDRIGKITDIVEHEWEKIFPDLTNTNLAKANLRGVDLSKAKISNTIIREKDLDGVIYLPEQLPGFIIDRDEEDLLNIPTGKGVLTINVAEESLPLFNLILITVFID